MRKTIAKILIALAFLFNSATAYEINNHADMSETAVSMSQLADARPTGTLFRLGLKPLQLGDEKQPFPLEAGLGPIPYCFGSISPGPGILTTWATLPQKPGERPNQPDWVAGLGIADMIRYGACYEDATEVSKRPFAHFYNPQNNGAPLTELNTRLGPSSLHWILKRDPSDTLATGSNHYTWMDARDYFYRAITQPRKIDRSANWGKTFQALGHIVHHLQDMGSPQHVRNDSHCNDNTCQILDLGSGTLYRPSGYEMFFEQQALLVRNLATTATAPMIFGLPRQFWNSRTDDSLNTQAMERPEESWIGGIAAYTSSNFTSPGKDFEVGGMFSSRLFQPASGLPFPEPSNVFNDVPMTDLFSGTNLEQIRVNLCNGDATKCKLRFMGTQTDPSAKTSSASVFSQKSLRPETAYSGPGVFQQNFFTYQDAGTKLVPRAVEYSAGLIDYFFRGEFSIRPPEEHLYGLLDGGDENSNCKDACGFRKIRARVTNTTPNYGGSQDMTAGKLLAVVRFSRNSCYQSDWSGDLGELNPMDTQQQNACYVAGATEPVEEVVVSAHIDVTSMAVGAEQLFTFDFSANPVPINAWNLQLQIVFRGTLGAEPDAVATSTVQMSAPTVLRVVNENDWIWINPNFYKVADIKYDQSVLSRMHSLCVVTSLIDHCFPPSKMQVDLKIGGNVALANSSELSIGTLHACNAGRPRSAVRHLVVTSPQQ